MNEYDYACFINALKRQYGLDLGKYRREHVEPKVREACRLWNYQDLEDFSAAMLREKYAFNELVNFITVSLTEFFRNRSEWNFLSKKMLPELLKENQCPVFWSAGCSTGEEPFSLAILLRSLGLSCQTTIFATDILETLLITARKGFYRKNALHQIPDEYKTDWPLERGLNFEVNPDVKKKVSFLQHDMLSNVFEKNLDMILCRNVLTQFTFQAREEMYRNFSYSLRPGGLLFIGFKEQIDQPGKYGLMEIRPHFYRRDK